MQCPVDFPGHESGKQPHNERYLTTVNKTKKWPKMQAYSGGVPKYRKDPERRKKTRKEAKRRKKTRKGAKRRGKTQKDGKKTQKISKKTP